MLQIDTKARGCFCAVVQFNETQVQLPRRRVRPCARERAACGPDDRGRQLERDMESPGDGRFAQERELNLLGVDVRVR